MRLQPNIDGLSFDEVLLMGLVPGIVTVLVTRRVTRRTRRHSTNVSLAATGHTAESADIRSGVICAPAGCMDSEFGF